MKTLSNLFIRVLFAVPFILFGILHILEGKTMAGVVPSYIPWPTFWVYLTGVGMFAAGVSFIINKMAKLAGVLLAVMLLIFIVTIWLPQVAAGSQSAMAGMLKDIALLAGALMISGMSKN